MLRLLFVCSQNRLRSPTAEQIFATYPNVEVASAGTNQDAQVVVCPELLEWATIIFVMERVHQDKISKKFRVHLKGKRIVCLNIPDQFEFMDPKLVSLLKSKVHPYLKSG
jgi:predicted protein tyrosine phosphatase